VPDSRRFVLDVAGSGTRRLRCASELIAGVALSSGPRVVEGLQHADE